MIYTEQVYWNSNSYGNALRVKKGIINTLIVVLCLVTPCTNWMIPFVRVKKDYMLRYG